MCGTAAHLTDHVVPEVPLRQWVFSGPFELRLLLARDPRALTAVGRIFVQEIDPQLHLVALTGYGQATDRERALQAGFNRHLVKPLDIAQVLDALPTPDDELRLAEL